MGTGILIAADEEARVLGIVLSHPEYMAKAATQLSEEHFASPKMRGIWKAAYAVFQRTGAVQLTALVSEMRKQKSEATISDLAQYRDAFLSPEEFEPCIEALELAATRRRIYAAAQKILEAAQDVNRDTPVELEITAQGFIWGALRQVGKQDIVHIAEPLQQVVEELHEAGQGRPSRRITTGFSETLDHRLGGGLAPGDLIILAGRTGTGKTALAEKIALHVAEKHGAVLYFSPEMSAEALARRAVQIAGPVHTERMRTPDAGALEKVDWVLKTVGALPLYIADQRSVSVPDIVAMSQAFQLEHPDLSLIVIDHFGELAIPFGGEKSLPRTMGVMASRLRQLAAELNVPLLLLHQLNRGVEGKRPNKADLRDSGRLEEIADIILLLYRDPGLPPELERLAELIVDKNRRTGWTRTLIIEFMDEFVRYQEAMPQWRAEYLRVVLKG